MDFGNGGRSVVRKDEPMTEKQFRCLQALHRVAGREMPDTAGMTRSEASTLIDELRAETGESTGQMVRREAPSTNERVLFGMAAKLVHHQWVQRGRAPMEREAEFKDAVREMFGLLRSIQRELSGGGAR